MTNLYFVRHGQSEGNFAKTHQLPDTPLSEQGLKQAAVIAERASHLPLDVIIASTYTRAQQTAEVIHQKTKLPLESSELLVEIRRPSVVHGRSIFDPEIQSIQEEILAHYHDENWRHSDEENFWEARARAVKFLQEMKVRPEENILVVSHGLFLALLVAVMLFGEELKSQEYLRFVEFVHTANTGLTWCSWLNNRWYLKTFNDHVHLAE